MKYVKTSKISLLAFSLQDETSAALLALPCALCAPAPDQLSVHPLELLPFASVFPVPENPRLDPVIQVWSHKCQMEGNNPFP